MSFLNIPKLTYDQIRPDAKICFVADFPSLVDQQVNQGYSDSAGSTLVQCMGHAGMSMAEASLIFLIPEACSQASSLRYWTPKGGFTTNATKHFPDFKNRLIEANANVYVPLGEIAMQALVPKKGITKWHGSILESIDYYGNVKVIPTMDPRAAIRQYLYRYYISFDLRRIKQECNYKELNLPKRNLIVQPSFTEACGFLDACMEAKEVAADIEVYKMEVSCISFATSPTLCMSIPFDTRWTMDEEVVLWRKVAAILESEKIAKIFQNGMFDISFLFARNKINTRGYIHDTMIKHNLNYPDFPKGLGFITTLYTREPYYKDEGKTWFNDLKSGSGSIDQFYIYNAKDSAICFEANDPITLELNKFGNVETYEFNQRLFRPLLYMMARGILIDEAALAEHRREARETRDRLQAKLNELCGFALNVSSPVQCKKFFYDIKKYKPQTKKTKDSKTGQRKESISADDKAMKRLIRMYGSEEAKLVTQIRKYRKLIGTYLEVNYDADKRLRCSFNMAGTATGRLSSSETIFGTGCLLPSAEVLTPQGWKTFESLDLSEEVMQWSADGVMSFCKPKFHRFKFSGMMKQAASFTHKNVYTPDHRVPTFGHRKNILTVKSAFEASLSQFYLPTGGHFDGSNNLRGLIAIIVMIQADGTIDESNIRLSFKKKDKIQRCINLLENNNIKYTEQKDSREDYRRFCIAKTDATLITQLLGKHKTFGSWLLDLDRETLEEFIKETQHWDSTTRGGSWIYSTVNEENARWVATIAHLTGYIATTRCIADNNRGYGVGNNKPLWNVNIKPGKFAIVEKQHWSDYAYSGFVYCVETPSTFFLTRYQGQITVTGNTNTQNLPKSFKKFLIADPGHVIVEVDKSQAEWVATAYVAGDARMIEACEADLDAHVHTANLMFGIPKELIEKEHEILETSTDEDYILEQRLKHVPDILKYKNILPNMSCRQAGKKCLIEGTEVLTKRGWVAIEYLADCDEVAQYDKGKISFKKPLEYFRYDNTEKLIELTANHVHQIVTGNHRILIEEDKGRKNQTAVVEAKDLDQRAHWHIPTSGIYNNQIKSAIAFSEEEIKLVVALQADGTVDNYGSLAFRFEKKRKIDRLEKILDALQLRYTKNEGCFFVHNTNKLVQKITYFMTKRKLFGSWLLENNFNTLQAFIEEIPYWDGYLEKKQYFSVIKQNAEWVQTIAHLTGRRATLKAITPKGFGTKDLYWVKIGKATGTSLVSVKKRVVETSGDVYCLSIESSFFLVRYQDKISVTGNSNHSFNYGLSPQGFAIQYDMELKYAKQCYALYHNAYPGLSLWHQHIRNKLGKDRTLENLFGRKRRFLNRWNEDLFKAAYSYIPQSTVGQLLNWGIVETYYQQDLVGFEFLRKWDLLNQVHDSMVFQYPIDDLEGLAKTIKQIQKNLDPKLYCNGRQFVIKTDCKIGLNCKDLFGVDLYAEEENLIAQLSSVIENKLKPTPAKIDIDEEIDDDEETSVELEE